VIVAASKKTLNPGCFSSMTTAQTALKAMEANQ